MQAMKVCPVCGTAHYKHCRRPTMTDDKCRECPIPKMSKGIIDTAVYCIMEYENRPCHLTPSDMDAIRKAIEYEGQLIFWPDLLWI